jgi:hypothetical protein
MYSKCCIVFHMYRKATRIQMGNRSIANEEKEMSIQESTCLGVANLKCDVLYGGIL